MVKKIFHEVAPFILLSMILMAVSSPGFAQETKINLKSGELIIKEGDAKFELGGALIWDYDYFETAYTDGDQEDDQGGGKSELRSASLQVKSQINKQWQAELEVSFKGRDSGMVVDDAYITSNLSKYLTLTIGNAKEPFGLEKLTSLKYIPTIERSMATSAFAPGQRPGLGLSGSLHKFTWAMGIFETDDGQDTRRTHALTGRLTFAPWTYRNRVLHFGLAGSLRDYNGGEYKINETAEVYTSDEIITSAEVRADQVNLLGLEAAWVIGPFSLRGEHMTVSIKTENGSNPGYSGYYLLGSYFLTGESYGYKEGIFRGWKSHRYSHVSEHSPDRRPVVMKQRDREGALELVIRYSVLDAEHNNTGVRAANLTLGINYYINKKIRFMVNYIHTDLAGKVPYHEDKAKAVSFRMQYVF